MTKRIKKYGATLLAALMLFACGIPASAQQTPPRLYNVYGDHMLFQQNADAVFAGEAAAGTVVSAALYDADGATVASGEEAADPTGVFRVALPAPAGGFDEYSVILRANGEKFATLNGVVFGELWLASGQSNMQYEIDKTDVGERMQQTGVYGSENLHIFAPSVLPSSDGSLFVYGEPQTDMASAHWILGNEEGVLHISAVAYHFAEKLLAELNVPVGILNTAVGGSSIRTWLSRETIDTSVAAAYLRADGEYIPSADWKDYELNFTTSMSGIYNTNVAPLTNFRPAGVIWYQGCSDLLNDKSVQYYCELFNLLQDSYTNCFAHTNGRLPFIFTQLAYYDYAETPYTLSNFNDAYTKLYRDDPSSRGLVTIYDVPLDYTESMGAIHPMIKKPIGERMAAAALGLLYGGETPASAATVERVKIENGSVYVSFKNTGDGLIANGGQLKGFAVCGANAVFTQANAEIIDKTTVRIWSEDVPAPIAAAYAESAYTLRANLWSSAQGEPYMPVAPFYTNAAIVKHGYTDAPWTDCETLSVWKGDGNDSAMIDAWRAVNASIAVSADDFTAGEGSLKLISEAKSFSVSPVISATAGLRYDTFDNCDANASDYGLVKLDLKNNSDKDVSLDAIRFYVNGSRYYCPVCEETGRISAVIPADGAWHTFVFDLNDLALRGLAGGLSYSNDKLNAIKYIRFDFSGPADGADVNLDNVRFVAEDDNPSGVRTSGRIASPETLLQDFVRMFADLAERIRALFSLLTNR